LSVGGGVLGVGLIILIIVLATGGRQSDHGGRQSDHDLIQGTWKNDWRRLEFTAETVLSQSARGGPQSTATYKLDPSKNPKEIDITEKGKTVLGIYAIDGDTLTICVNERFRPTELRDGPGCTFIVLKREKR
jgi:uncharacterized protein (TIGR03067 family)